MNVLSLSKILIIFTFLLTLICESVTHAMKILLIYYLKFVKTFAEAWLFERTKVGLIAERNAFIVAYAYWTDESHLHARFKSLASCHHLWPLLILIIIVWREGKMSLKNWYQLVQILYYGRIIYSLCAPLWG